MLFEAAAAVAFLLLSKKKGGTAPAAATILPPIVAAEPPLSADTGYPAGSSEDLASQAIMSFVEREDHRRGSEIAFESAIVTGAGIGASIGSALPGIGTAIGALIGAVVGWIAGVISVIGKGQPPPAPAFPLADIGAPFRPEFAPLSGAQLTVKLPALLPAQLAANRGSPAGTVDVSFPRDLLESLFPGDGALDSARRSGMLCWRPGDQETPFSRLLYETMPALWGYEASLIGTTPEDLAAGPLTLRWLGNDWKKLSEPQRQTLLILIARRLAVWRERRAPTTRIVQGSPVTYLRGHPEEPKRGTVLHEGTDFGLWLMFTYAARHQPPARDLGVLVYLANAVDVMLPVHNPRSASLRLTDLRTIGKDADAEMGLPPMPSWAAASVQKRKRTPSMLGFPGARADVSISTPLGPFPALPGNRERRGVFGMHDTPRAFVPPAALLRISDAPESGDAKLFRLVADATSQRLAGAATTAASLHSLYSTNAATLADLAAKLEKAGSPAYPKAQVAALNAQAEAAPSKVAADVAAKAARDFDPRRYAEACEAAEREPGAFRFRVWLPGYSCVATSSLWAPFLGSHAAVREALRTNRLAWTVGRLSAPILGVWHALDPRLPAAEKFLTDIGWEPFA